MATRIRIHSLHLYPLKGCRALDVESLALRDGRIVGDRSLMLVDSGTGKFVSQRHVPAMARIVVDADARSFQFDGDRCDLNPSAGTSRRSVTVWDNTFDANDLGDEAATTFSRWLGRSVRLVRLDDASPRAIDPFWTAGRDVRTSFADLAPLLVTNVASLDELNRRRDLVGLAAVPMARFRPNVVIEGLDAFAEDAVVELTHRDFTIRFIKPCARCKVTEIDALAGAVLKDGVLDVLAGFRTFANARGSKGIMFGQNATIDHSPGATIGVGDALDVIQR